jgi:hypothetical protein
VERTGPPLENRSYSSPYWIKAEQKNKTKEKGVLTQKLSEQNEKRGFPLNPRFRPLLVHKEHHTAYMHEKQKKQETDHRPQTPWS